MHLFHSPPQMLSPWKVLVRLVTAWTLSAMASADTTAEPVSDIDPFDLQAPAHAYWERPLQDRFTAFQREIEAGKITLDRSGEKAFVSSLLSALDVPESSQMLVFSTTSLQLSQISPRNPRALYFSDDIYIGWVPGARIEIASIDPELGCIFYIFDVPGNDDRPMQIERSNRCMNCHAGTETRDVPGLTIKSVIPGQRGGSLEAFRIDETGHSIPLSDRFGGWYLTGNHGLTRHHANATGKLWKGEISFVPVEPGQSFDWSRYPVDTSDILAHLLHEHQAGFVNRVIEGTYLARAFTHSGKEITTEQAAVLDSKADEIVNYILFADEAALPTEIEPDPVFAKDFLLNRRPASDGAALHDLHLRGRLFKYRCSYMIYTPLFASIPQALQSRILDRLDRALSPDDTKSYATHLPESERAAIRSILKDTLPNLPLPW